MKFLFCCEFYYPSVGGVQEVMRRVAEGLVEGGHQVTIATSRLPHRLKSEHNGVEIKEFNVFGNGVSGISGEVENYIQFVKNFECDALLIKAAQQWTFDSLWPCLGEIHVRKFFIPCGFSGLYEASFREYFQSMPRVLREFDALIFYSANYRDIEFAKLHGCRNLILIPNGASGQEFLTPKDEEFRKRHGIPKNSFLILTVGSLTGAKGHQELAEAFYKINIPGRHLTLILNGNIPEDKTPSTSTSKLRTLDNKSVNFLKKLNKQFGKILKRSFDILLKCSRILYSEGLRELFRVVKKEFQRKFFYTDGLGIEYWVNKTTSNPYKKVLLTDFSRDELINAFKDSNLFVFASNIEYSPLVLFEAAAAGLPFLSVPVGNAEEIASWTQGGIICPAIKTKAGYIFVDPKILAKNIESLIFSDDKLLRMGMSGRKRWEEHFTWEKITKMYEDILTGKKMEAPLFLKRIQ